MPDHFRDEWLMVARYPYRYELYVEHFSGKPRLVSNYAGGVALSELENDLTPASFRVTYLPESMEMRVTRNGAEILRHKIGPLVAAPSQIQVTARPL